MGAVFAPPSWLVVQWPYFEVNLGVILWLEWFFLYKPYSQCNPHLQIFIDGFDLGSLLYGFLCFQLDLILGLDWWDWVVFVFDLGYFSIDGSIRFCDWMIKFCFRLWWWQLCGARLRWWLDDGGWICLWDGEGEEGGEKERERDEIIRK